MRYSRWLLALAIIILFLLSYSYFMQNLRIKFSLEQVQLFCEMAENAEGKPKERLKEVLVYVENYYPSGTKQVKGSDLDVIVETVRRRIMKQLIEDIEEIDKKGMKRVP